MVPDVPTAALIGGSTLLFGGTLTLRKSWRAPRDSKPIFRFGGWSLIAAGIFLIVQVFGGEVGSAYSLLLLPLAAFVVIAAGVEIRRTKQRLDRETAPEPEDRQTNWTRAIAKSLLSIVLAGIAAIGLGVAFAVAMPLPPTDRIVLGGLLVPVLWGGGMAWTLCDAKLLRATILLLAVSAIGYGIAFLPKVLS